MSKNKIRINNEHVVPIKYFTENMLSGTTEIMIKATDKLVKDIVADAIKVWQETGSITIEHYSDEDESLTLSENAISVVSMTDMNIQGCSLSVTDGEMTIVLSVTQKE